MIDRAAGGDRTIRRDLLREIPQVEKLLREPGFEPILRDRPREEVVDALRATLEEVRRLTLGGELGEEELRARVSPDGLRIRVRDLLAERRLSGYRRAVNATGVILHTGLGRAVLSPEALEAVADHASGYCLLEVDVETGERGQRDTAVAALLRRLSGAEDATAVNNNAAATLIILASLARGKEVVISRGQLIEIGGSFRIPEILRESGARLVEVGTTNRTYAEDYRRAIGPETGLLLQVHTSNYEIRGFAHHTPLEELVALGREHGLPVVADLGSGCFVDLAPYGFRPEPLAGDAVRRGADLVCFSGDKLLGGPQAGIIVGKADAVRRVRAHPLFRPLRVDKVTLLLLESTLRAYVDPERSWTHLPALRAIVEPLESVRRRAEECAASVRERGASLEVDVVSSGAQAGSGALPAQEIPSAAVRISHPGLPPGEVSRRLRANAPPIFSLIREGRVLLDFRTVLPEDAAHVIEALASLA